MTLVLTFTASMKVKGELSSLSLSVSDKKIKQLLQVSCQLDKTYTLLVYLGLFHSWFRVFHFLPLLWLERIWNLVQYVLSPASPTPFILSSLKFPSLSQKVYSLPDQPPVMDADSIVETISETFLVGTHSTQQGESESSYVQIHITISSFL